MCGVCGVQREGTHMLFSMPMSAMKVKLSTIIDFIFT